MSPIKKRIVIEIDVVNGDFEKTNEDGLTHFEIAGILEYAKMINTEDWLKWEKD